MREVLADAALSRRLERAEATAGALLGACLLAACNPVGPSSLTEPRFGIEIRLAHGSRDELRTRDQLVARAGPLRRPAVARHARGRHR